MAGKGKKGQKNEKPAVPEKAAEEPTKKADSKEEEMNKIMAGINSMDLDN